jgi:two-component system LytT family response regulator
MTDRKLRVMLIDDEALALKRLARLLTETGRVEIVAQETDPETARSQLSAPEWRSQIDALFLDIQMPGMNGFELLTRLNRLNWQPFVIFTTAYDQYALKAFEVNSIDYLLKPVERAQLDRALRKLERIVASPAAHALPPDFREVIAELAETMKAGRQGWPTRVASRVGERVRFIELSQITHFFARDKLTYAATAAPDGGEYVIDRTVAELESELDPQKFIRIHRAILLNVDFVDEAHAWFGGRLVVRLRDNARTELTVARDRVRALKAALRF